MTTRQINSGGGDGRPAGLAGCALAGVIGLISLGGLPGSQAMGWAQVPLKADFPDAVGLTPIPFWSNGGGLVLATLGFLALSAKRGAWLLGLAALALAAMALAPEPPAVQMILIAAGFTSIAIGFFRGELENLVGIDPATAQGIAQATFLIGLFPTQLWFYEQADRSGAGAFAWLALGVGVCCVVAVGVFRRSRPAVPAGAGDGFWATARARRRAGWRPRTAWGFVLVTVSSAVMGSQLPHLTTVLEQHGNGGIDPYRLAQGTQALAGLVILLLWSAISTRWQDRGVRPLALIHLAGGAILVVAGSLEGSAFMWVHGSGLVILGFAHNAYVASAFGLTVRDGFQGLVVTAALPLGPALASQIVASFLSGEEHAPGGIAHAVVAVAFACVLVLVTIARAPTIGHAPDGSLIEGSRSTRLDLVSLWRRRQTKADLG